MVDIGRAWSLATLEKVGILLTQNTKKRSETEGHVWDSASMGTGRRIYDTLNTKESSNSSRVYI